jgi:transposase
MSSNKHRKLKRNPIVRFIRGVFRLFRVLFRPKQDVTGRLEAKAQAIALINAQHQAELDELRAEQAQWITVGELFEQVKWQSAPASIQKEVATNSRVDPAYDVSRN